MAYRTVTVRVPVNQKAFIPPPLCFDQMHFGMPVQTRFTGHQGPTRFFTCPQCGRVHVRTVR